MKNKILIILSIISTLAIICWMITDFYGGMIVYLIMYRWILLPLIIIYGVTLLITLIKTIKDGINSNKALFYTHLVGLLAIIIFNLYQSELLKSKILLNSTLEDDLSSINLILRENGKFETNSSGMFGYSDKISGHYIKKNDTIIFLKKPYRNDYIPDTIIIAQKDSAIFFRKAPNGEFSREKTFVNYFRIIKNEF